MQAYIPGSTSCPVVGYPISGKSPSIITPPFTGRLYHRKEVKSMSKKLTEKDIADGKKIAEIFADLSEENKNMAIVYISALRDKEVADSNKQLVEV